MNIILSLVGERRREGLHFGNATILPNQFLNQCCLVTSNFVLLPRVAEAYNFSTRLCSEKD